MRKLQLQLKRAPLAKNLEKYLYSIYKMSGPYYGVFNGRIILIHSYRQNKRGGGGCFAGVCRLMVTSDSPERTRYSSGCVHTALPWRNSQKINNNTIETKPAHREENKTKSKEACADLNGLRAESWGGKRGNLRSHPLRRERKVKMKSPRGTAAPHGRAGRGGAGPLPLRARFHTTPLQRLGQRAGRRETRQLLSYRA